MSGRVPNSVGRAGRYLLVAVGVLAFLLALLPGGAGYLPIETLVERVGNEYFLLGTLGGVAVGVLGWMVLRRASGRVRQADPPDPETVRDAPPPGATFDRAVGGLPLLSTRRDGPDAEGLRRRLRTAVVATLMREEGVTRERAEQRVDDGVWTDDPVAARFLDTSVSPPSLRERLRFVLRGDSWVQRGARAVARALTERDGSADGDGGER